MKINLKQQLLTLEGKPFMDGSKEITMKGAIKACLISSDRANSDAEGKMKRFETLMKVHNAENTVELETEEIMELKLCSQSYHSVLFHGMFVYALEGKAINNVTK